MTMSEEAAGPQVEVLPTPTIPHDGTGAMGALTNAAETLKRPATGADADAPAAKKSNAAAADNDEWNALLGQIRGHLSNMPSDECFSRALELQMLARSEVGTRSNHLSNAMDKFLGNGGVAAKGTVTRAEREVLKQKPIKTDANTMPLPMIKMTPPLPPYCQHDNVPDMEVPHFSQLVNFPQARYEGRCVMCGSSEYNIPKQNKGVCNNCDVAIWVHNPSGMNLKWCKGSKNFKKWIDFGVKVCSCHDYLCICCAQICIAFDIYLL